MASKSYDLITKFKVDMGNFKSEMGNAEKTIGSTASGLGKLAGAAAVAFSATALVGFAKTAIETTAKLRAMDSQYAQVFKDETGVQMMDRLKQVSSDANIQIDRLTGTANKFGAQFKGAGIESASAMEMTEKATRLAADSAAFYDTSMETATGSLSSFLKGNFEAGDAIGVFTNATQMSKAATDKFGVSWQDLTEAQKQTLLLEKVDEVYKLNGAMGQAGRESKSWENITGNLKATWSRFLTVVGGPILAAVTPIIEGITKGIGFLQDRLGQMDFSFFDEFKNNLQFLKDGFQGIGDPEALEGISKIFYDVGKAVGTVRDLIVAAMPAIKETISGVFQGIQSVWETYGAPIFTALLESAKSIVQGFQDSWPTISGIIEGVFTRIQGVWETILLPAFTAIMNFITQTLKPTFDQVFPLIQDVVSTVFTEISGFWTNTLLPVFDAIIAFVRDTLGPIFAQSFPIIQAAVESAFSVIKSVWESVLKPAFQGVMDILNNSLMPAFEVAFPIIKDAVEMAFTKIKALWDGVLKPAFDAIKDILDNTVKPTFEKVFPAIQSAVDLAFTAIKAVWDGILKPAFEALTSFIEAILKPLFDTAFPAIQRTVEDAFKAVGTAVDTMKTVFDGIKGTIDNVVTWFNNLKRDVSAAIEAVRLAVDGAITKIKGLLDFEWKWPDIKMPVFDIVGSLNPLDWPSQGLPRLTVDWNAAGGIFTEPTIFATSAGLQGVGEAGPEAILPLKKLPGLLKPYFMQRGESVSDRAEVSTEQRPLEVVLKMGSQAYRAFVDGVSAEQEQEVELELMYS